MQNHILLFHIGMPKTGTSSLQKFLYNNDGILRKYGWAYPNVYPDNYPVYCNGYKLLTPLHKNDVKKWDSIQEMLKKYNVIISDEHYWFSISDFWNDLSFAQGFCNNIRVIVYLRRQDRAVESMYNQIVKRENEHGSIMDYLNQRVTWPIDYLDVLEKISSIIGRQNVIVRVYEKKQLKGYRNDIISDFMDALPGDPIIYNWDEFVIPKRENLALNNNFFEIKKICNSTFESHDKICWIKNQVNEFARISGMKQNRTSMELITGYFNKSERIALLDSQAQNNAEIARKYLNRPDGKLFYDDCVDYPVYQDQADDFLRDAIQVLYSMLYIQQRKTEMAPIVAATVLLKKGRKLAFWGIGDNGKQLYEYALLPDIIIDNDPEKYHTSFKEIPVIPSHEIENWKEYFTVVTPTFPQSIESVLIQKGLKKNKDYVLVNDFFDFFAIY